MIKQAGSQLSAAVTPQSFAVGEVAASFVVPKAESGRPLDKVNVHRLIAVVRRKMSQAVRGHCYEPNDDITRWTVSELVNDFLYTLKERNAIADYVITCNELNNTPENVAAGKLSVDVTLKLSPAADFGINLRSVATTGCTSWLRE